MKFVKTLAILAIIASASRFTVQADELITLAELKEHAETVRKFQPVDQFDLPPNFAELVGRSFVFEIDGSSGCRSELSHSYSDKTLQFIYGESASLFPYLPYGLRERYLSDVARTYALECTITQGEPYLASNAFGQTVSVLVSTHYRLAMGTLKEDGIYYYGGYKWEIALEPNEARELSKVVRGRIAGHISKWPTGEAILCGRSSSEPTFTRPLKIDSWACFVNVNFERIELFNSVTGEILKSWVKSP